MSNLVSGLHDEICRNKEILKEYEAIGSPGQFGAIMIRDCIKRGEIALGGGGVVEMLIALRELKETK